MAELRPILAIVPLLLPGCRSIPRAQVNVPHRHGVPRPLPRFDHGTLDGLLQQYVDDDGLVDYPGLLGARVHLDAYLNSLADVDLQALVDEDERTAFWINAYNAITLAGILHHYPTRSIRDLAGFWDNVVADCGGRLVTLNQIEHAILRPLGDPRIHMAINCASRGCPRLWNHAYSGAELKAQLDLAARTFLGDPRRNRFHVARRHAELSMIFSWFAPDFAVAPYFGVRGFVRRYAPGLLWPGDEYAITYLPYDWSLNEQRRVR